MLSPQHSVLISYELPPLRLPAVQEGLPDRGDLFGGLYSPAPPPIMIWESGNSFLINQG